jgi:Protein of unknown function (DUF2934)
MAKPKKTNAGAATAAECAPGSLLRPPIVTDSDVAHRAYELYVARGSGHGHDVDDWTAAERELRARSTTT